MSVWPPPRKFAQESDDPFGAILQTKQSSKPLWTMSKATPGGPTGKSGDCVLPTTMTKFDPSSTIQLPSSKLAPPRKLPQAMPPLAVSFTTKPSKLPAKVVSKPPVTGGNEPEEAVMPVT